MKRNRVSFALAAGAAVLLAAFIGALLFYRCYRGFGALGSGLPAGPNASRFDAGTFINALVLALFLLPAIGVLVCFFARAKSRGADTARTQDMLAVCAVLLALYVFDGVFGLVFPVFSLYGSVQGGNKELELALSVGGLAFACALLAVNAGLLLKRTFADGRRGTAVYVLFALSLLAAIGLTGYLIAMYLALI